MVAAGVAGDSTAGAGDGVGDTGFGRTVVG